MLKNTYRLNKQIFLTTLFLLVVFGLGGCLARENKVSVNKIKSNSLDSYKKDSIVKSDNNEENINNQNEKVKQGMLFDLGDGRKRYTSLYFGIEFEFVDKDNIVKIFNAGNSIGAILSPTKNPIDDRHIYIFINHHDLQDYNTFKEALWTIADVEVERTTPGYGVKNIKEFINKNNTTIFKTTVRGKKYLNAMQVDPGKYVDVDSYWLSYAEPERLEPDQGRSIYEKYNTIHIYNEDNFGITKEIINTFRFIKQID